MAKIYLSLGSNLRDRQENIRQALELLEHKGVRILQVSSFYETEPLYIVDQPWFLNVAAEVQSELAPQSFFELLQQVELSLGRERKVRFGPRTIDIDILFYGNELFDHSALQIPHPRLQERKFVLVPMAELAPDFIHPVLKKSMSELLKKCSDSSKIKKVLL
jgi:2-amino-4-hydroxy-6-hydroxymethyldihydropteridine diphosphokinase